MRKQKILSIILFFLSVLFSCNTPLPQDVHTIFTEWFINQDEKQYKILCSNKITKTTIDSLVHFIRMEETRTGATRITLTDNTANPYTLGFLTPSDYTPDTLYPLIVYLHGGINTASTTKGENAFEMFRFLADTIPIFIASPSANRDVPWWSASGLFRILQTVRYMSLYFPVDPDRIFLAGVSDGATGCYAAANTIPAPFAGFIAVSGYGGLLFQLGMELQPLNIMKRPMYNINAGNDRLYPIEIVNQFLDWLESNGVALQRKVYPDEEHGFEYREMEKGNLVTIMRTWKKPHTTAASWKIVPGVPNCADNILSWKPFSPEDGQIVAYWKNDTLAVKAKGIDYLEIIKSDKNKNRLFYETGNEKARPVTVSKNSCKEYLSLLQHYCYPVVVNSYIITIK